MHKSLSSLFVVSLTLLCVAHINAMENESNDNNDQIEHKQFPICLVNDNLRLYKLILNELLDEPKLNESEVGEIVHNIENMSFRERLERLKKIKSGKKEVQKNIDSLILESTKTKNRILDMLVVSCNESDWNNQWKAKLKEVNPDLATQIEWERKEHPGFNDESLSNGQKAFLDEALMALDGTRIQAWARQQKELNREHVILTTLFLQLNFTEQPAISGIQYV